ncbi:hypothetical protein CRV24_006765 [Beauveria bassiana]|nr:hypothetical protein CRV24_006765 [Beauveria bassiana]
MKLSAVHIYNGHHLFCAVFYGHNWDHNLALALAVASNVAGKLLHVLHELRGLRLSRDAADATAKGNDLAGHLALKGTENQLRLRRGRVQHVESCALLGTQSERVSRQLDVGTYRTSLHDYLALVEIDRHATVMQQRWKGCWYLIRIPTHRRGYCKQLTKPVRISRILFINGLTLRHIPSCAGHKKDPLPAEEPAHRRLPLRRPRQNWRRRREP